MLRGFIKMGSLYAAAIIAALCSGPLTAQAEKMKVAIVLPGVITDKSFNQAGYEGVKRAAEELGLEMAYSEKVPQPDQPEALSDYARRGYQVVIGYGGEFQESVDRVARRHPDTMFIVVNGTEPSKNVAVMGFAMKDMGYVIGYIAGKTSESGVGGYIGAQKIKAYVELEQGFLEGFKAARPDGQALSAWTNDWDDIAKGKEAALNLISQGADTIFPTMDNGVIGSLQALREKKKDGFGIYYDAIVDWPDTVIQSAILDMRGALGEILATAVEGNLEGKAYIYGFESPNAFRLGTYSDAVSQGVQGETAEIIKKIEAGEL